MLHLVGYFQNVDQGGAAALINAIPDETLYAVDDDIRVPPEVANLAGAAVLTAAGTFTSALVKTPSLRTRANYDVSGISLDDVFANPPNFDCMAMNPIPLAPNETMTFETNTDDAAAQNIYGLVLLSDGPTQSVQGQQFTVRTTAAASLSAGQWVNSNLTFIQDLPSGTYDVVGMKAVGNNLVAARLVFPGGKWRPGVPASVGLAAAGFMKGRNGELGVMGSFDQNNPPSVDCLGETDASQTIFLDLIKTS